ncbi:uncharacterized protein LOC131023793 [Salvia miltiorrhiza]|uniref:uncharacterized protein LOC131023793 n=1 Tax=Salvia miltiorrhiza TaxID=226208 RepID=UPI0025AC320F|nr:uncharacterized protein LOC131023793 [Salvia miltiorrhiza]
MSSPEHDSSPDSDEVAEKFMELVELQKQLLQSYCPQPASEPARAKRPRSYVHRDREEAHVRLMQDYFVDNPTYGPTFFQNRHGRMWNAPSESFKLGGESFEVRRNWYVEHLKDIMLCCIILHNMIVEHEGEAAANWRDDDGASSSGSTESAGQTPVSFEEYVRRDSLLRDRQLHAQLRYDLIEHLWARFGPLGPE